MPYVHAKGLPTVELLKVFAAKARCSHTQRRAEECWRELEQRLTGSELTVLFVAWDHARLGEGPVELDTAVANLAGGLADPPCGNSRCRGKAVQWGYCWGHAPC